MKFLITTLLILWTSSVWCQENVGLHYKIFDTRKQKMVSVDDIINNMENADVLFFGEEHNDSTCHALESELLNKMAAKYAGKTALSMEMFETDCQNVLNEYLEGLIREKNFTTEARAWHNYKDYRPMIEFAKAQHIPVLAANAPARYVNMVNRMGMAGLDKLDKYGKKWLPPLPIDTATGAYYQNFLQIMGAHSGVMNGMQMYQAQNLWDATMGWSISRFYKKHRRYKILQVNGSFHSEDHLGTVSQLKRYARKIRVLNIAYLQEDNFDNPDLTKFSKNNDYILLTDPKLQKTF
jgi:uncharacterized iron-regulated protein